MSKEVKITMDRTRAEMMKREHKLKNDDELWWKCYNWSAVEAGDTFKVRVREKNGKLKDLQHGKEEVSEK